MKVGNSIGVFGEYKAQVVKDGKVVRELPWQKNLVTDQAISRFFADKFTISTNYLFVGTGNTAPATTDVELDNAIASHTSVVTVSTPTDTSSEYAVIKKYIFSAGTATGTLAELGLACAATGGNISFTPSTTQYMCTRALFKDGGGSPTTLTVLADEELQVLYKVGHMLELDVGGDPISETNSITLDGNSYTWTTYINTTKIKNIDIFGGATIAYEGATVDTVNWEVGTRVTGSTDSAIAFSDTTTAGASKLVHDVTFTTVEANFGSGINAIEIRGAPYTDVVVTFSPAIPKTSLQELTLSFEFGVARA